MKNEASVLRQRAQAAEARLNEARELLEEERRLTRELEEAKKARPKPQPPPKRARPTDRGDMMLPPKREAPAPRPPAPSAEVERLAKELAAIRERLRGAAADLFRTFRPLSIGEAGERLAQDVFEASGYKVHIVQYDGAHGVDLLVEGGPTKIAVEVKTSTGATAPKPSAAQKDASSFVRDRLEKAASNVKLSQAQREAAERFLADFDQVSFRKVEITKLGKPDQAVTFTNW
jgi:Holliday junction resolvase-like predicted endonuclease